jgi:hypothetical protein
MKSAYLVSIRRILVLAGLAVGGAALVAGCEGPPETVDDEAEVGEVESAITGGCGGCQWGSYTCPTNGAMWDYDTPGCGPRLKSQAYTQCNAACGPACIDSGWQGGDC